MAPSHLSFKRFLWKELELRKSLLKKGVYQKKGGGCTFSPFSLAFLKSASTRAFGFFFENLEILSSKEAFLKKFRISETPPFQLNQCLIMDIEN